MKSNFILNSILVGTAFFSMTVLGHKEVFLKEDLNTHGNTVGIKSGDRCHVIYSPHASKHHNCMVICEGTGTDDKIFKNVGKVIGSATGTPGWLEYKNYIGSKVMDTGNTADEAGGVKRVILCDGPCEKKEEGEEHHKMRIMPIEMPS